MPARQDADFAEWIWVPPGFAHGNFFTEESLIEYFCSGEYSQGCEAGISPLAKDINWSLCDPGLKQKFDSIVPASMIISDKDKDANSVKQWLENKNSENFIYGNL